MAKKQSLFYPQGLIYDAVFGRLLRSVRLRVARAVAAEDLFPCLDVGCGTGHQLRFLGPKGGPVVGLDLGLPVLKYAAARARTPLFVNGDARGLPFRDRTFESVIMSFALHDKNPPDRPRILGEALRLLAPAGRMILVDFEPAWNAASRRGGRLLQLIELLAPRDHYRNGREFIGAGGLRAFLAANRLRECSRHDVEAGSFSVVVAAPEAGTEPRPEGAHSPRHRAAQSS
jgi:SAM-dependent methyltransferase